MSFWINENSLRQRKGEEKGTLALSKMSNVMVGQKMILSHKKECGVKLERIEE